MKFKQLGRNKKYPDTIETWRFGEDVPEWISDICKINAITGEGKAIIDYRKTNTGGFELLDSNGSGSKVVSARNMTDYICFGSGKIFSLTEKQLSLLYGEIKNNYIRN